MVPISSLIAISQTRDPERIRRLKDRTGIHYNVIQTSGVLGLGNRRESEDSECVRQCLRSEDCGWRKETKCKGSRRSKADISTRHGKGPTTTVVSIHQTTMPKDYEPGKHAEHGSRRGKESLVVISVTQDREGPMVHIPSYPPSLRSASSHGPSTLPRRS